METVMLFLLGIGIVGFAVGLAVMIVTPLTWYFSKLGKHSKDDTL